MRCYAIIDDTVLRINSLDTLFGDGRGVILGDITGVEASQKHDKVLDKKNYLFRHVSWSIIKWRMPLLILLCQLVIVKLKILYSLSEFLR